MMTLMRPVAPLVACTFLIACEGGFQNPFDQSETPAPVIVEDVAADAPLDATGGAIAGETEVVEVGAGGANAETLDTTTEAEKAAATNVSAPASGLLGETVASLGDPTKPGFWLKTPLVSEEREGRIEREGGAVAQVTLLPLDGPDTGGSQISLSAMRALDISLTDLATLKVYSN